MKRIPIFAAAMSMMLVSGCGPAADALFYSAIVASEVTSEMPAGSTAPAGNTAPTRNTADASRQLTKIHAYSLNECVQMISANPRYFLSGVDAFEGTPVVYNRCPNASFVLFVCYDGHSLMLLDDKHYMRMRRNSSARVGCLPDQKLELHPLKGLRVNFPTELRLKMQDEWNRKHKN